MALELFPVTTAYARRAGRTCLTIAGCDLVELAQEHGTPLYLYDRATLEAAVESYRTALQRYYPGEAGLTYAGKAFLCLALAQWCRRQGLWLDGSSAGEVAVAVAAGLPREQIVVHGVNKGPADLAAAQAHAGTVVVDNPTELARWAERATAAGAPFPQLWLRLRPGLPVATHAYIQTGREESKFGMGPAEAEQALQQALEHGLPLAGLHFHLGSHFRDPAPLGAALQQVLELAAAWHARFGWTPQALSPGGGWGVAYHPEELPHPPTEAYVRFVAEALVAGCHRHGLPLPRLQLEPGRSLVARAGVALYRVGTIKWSGGRRWLLLDGGLADNPRPALYGTRYFALSVLEPERPSAGPAWLGGPYCESGDVLIAGLPLPDVQEGELLAVPMSGAYQLSMASNYNGAGRPAVLWLEAGTARLIRERETAPDLLRHDRPLEG